MVATEDAIEYKICFIAFLDILGFSSKVIESQDSSEKLKTLIESLKVCGAFPSAGKKETNSGGSRRLIDIRSRFFSDTIVFFVKENKRDLSQLFFMIRYLQDRLWEKGICLRGAVTIGQMYWPEEDENITVGPAVIDAHNLESTISIYPRVVLSKELYKYIEIDKVKADPFGGGLHADSPHQFLQDYIRQDTDGVYFLNLLHPDVLRTNDERLTKVNTDFSVNWNFLSETNHQYILSKVNNTISDNIVSNDPKICQKYEWLKSYVESIEATGD